MNKCKWKIWLLLAWFATGLLLVFFARQVEDSLWILSAVVYLIFAVVGLFLGVLFIINAVKTKNRHCVFAAVGTGCLGLILIFSAPYISSFGENVIVQYRFDQHIAQYRQIVAEANAGHLAEGYGEHQGVRYQIDKGPPIRVAFIQPGSILDNWEGIVYDPTGDVLKARGRTGPDGKLSAPSEIVSLFGGTLVSCVKIQDDYYRCAFT